MPRSPLAKWDILRDNGTLKELIKRRMDEENLSMAALGKGVDIPYDHIRQYLKGKYRWKGISQYNLVRLADYLGVRVGLNIELKYRE